jgi:hypothetical protein
LRLNAATGVLDGSVSLPGTSSLTVTAAGADGQIAQRTFSLTAIAQLQIVTASLPGAVVGGGYSATLAAAGGDPPFAWSATGLPPGLGLDPASGVISGTLAAQGTFPSAYTVQSADGQTSSRTLSIVSVSDVAGTYIGNVERYVNGNGTSHIETMFMVVKQVGDQIEADFSSIMISTAPSDGPTGIPNDSPHGPLHLTAQLLGDSHLANVSLTNGGAAACPPGGFGLNGVVPLAFGGPEPHFFRLNLLESDCHAITGASEMLDGLLLKQ